MKHNLSLVAYLSAATTILLPSYAEAALANPSFESGTGTDADNWTEFGAAGREDWADGDGTYSDGGGTDYGMALKGWTPGGEMNGGFYQDTPATVGLDYTFTANMHFEPNFNPTVFEIKLEWIGAGTQTIQSLLGFPTSTTPGTTTDWNEYSVTGTAPAGTTTVRTTIIFQGATDIGGQQAGRVDNVTLVAVPEPSSTALLGLGALGVLIRRRR